MTRFRFRLERLLTIRRYHERMWELKLAEATRSVLETRGGIDRAQEGIAMSFDQVARTPETPMIVAAERYRQGLAARIVTLGVELEAREKVLETVRTGYLDASRRRKVLDKLRERQMGTWRTEQNRQEIALSNEIGAVRAARRASGLDTGA